MREFHFWVRRAHNSASELLVIHARSSCEAVDGLPPCISWDFVVGGR